MRLLIVEDDPLVADALVSGLRAEGFTADLVGSAEQAETALRTEHFDLAVLDLGLPGAGGLDWLRRLRVRGERIPVLILTARDGVDDRIDGLNFGADDYMVKPFELRELVARCRALIRRTGTAVSSTQMLLGDLSMDATARELHVGERRVELTPREWAILEYLLLHAQTVVGKDKLLQAISGWDDPLAPNAVEVYVSRVRAKLEGSSVSIRTVRGVGYRLEIARTAAR